MLATLYTPSPVAAVTAAPQAMDSLVVTPVSDGFVRWSDAHGISSPSWILPAEDRVFVFTQRPVRVWVLDSTGTEVGAFGREGQGPREFRQFTGVQIQDDSLVVIYDRGNGRITTWTFEGELVGSLSEARAGSVGRALAVIGDGQIVRPAAGTDPLLLELPDQDNLPASLRRTAQTGTPFSLDLLAASGKFAAVFENAVGRLVLLDPEFRSVRSEVRLPGFLRYRMDEALRAATRGQPAGAIPTQYARSLTVNADGRSLTILLAGPTRAGIIGARVESDGEMTLIAVDPRPPRDNSNPDLQVTTFAALGDCYLLGTAMGVQRFCP